MRENAMVLIVDDNHVNVDILKRSLEMRGYDISMAPSGEVALKIAPKLKPDLILMDLMMPGMDGFETCKRLKEDSGLKDIPVIFVTGKTETQDIVNAFQAGGVDYITKPFREEEVFARVNAQINIKKLMEEKEELIHQLDMLARVDPLTQLSNRRAAQEALENEKERYERYATCFSLIMGDIDFFKQLNDQYGHDTGDYVLEEIAALIKNNIRKVDHAARWGGEEFLLVLPDADQSQAGMVGEKIRAAVESWQGKFEGQKLKVTMSFGAASISKENNDIEKIIKAADMNLYKAKEKGRNQIVAE